MRLTFILVILTVIALSWLYNQPAIIEDGVAFVAPERIKKAMRKMGSLKEYRVLPCGKLQVKVEDKWLYLKY